MRVPKVVNGPTKFQVIRSLFGSEIVGGQRSVTFHTNEGHIITACVTRLSKKLNLTKTGLQWVIEGMIEQITHPNQIDFCNLSIEKVPGCDFNAKCTFTNEIGSIRLEGVHIQNLVHYGPSSYISTGKFQEYVPDSM